MDREGRFVTENDIALGKSAADISIAALEELGREMIKQKALDVSRQVEIYLAAHPNIATGKISKDLTLVKIAVQPVGETGYTCLYEQETGIMRSHTNPELVDFDMHNWRDKLPSWWKIFEPSLNGSIVGGYYDWEDANRNIRKKFMYMVPVEGTQYMVAATTYIDEFLKSSQEIRTRIMSLEQKVEERTRAERRRAEQLRAINEVGRRISSILSLDELLPYIVNSLRETFNYYNVNILLLDPSSGALTFKAGAGGYTGSVPVGLSLKLAEGIAGWVAQTGEPLLANDVSKEPKYRFVEELADTQSELAVSIKIRNEILGVLDIESAELNAFDEMDLFTAQTLADQVAIAIENARLYQETRDMAVLEERNRMAREIHDTLAQGFTGIVLQLEAAEQALDEDAHKAQEHLDRARRLARESLNEARRSVWALRPQTLEQLPLAEALGQEVDNFTRSSGIKTNFDISGDTHPLYPDIESSLLRICQESLTNVRKHARARKVDVNLAFEEKVVRLSVQDNGIGFDPEAPTEGAFGLIGMRERARLVGGALVVQSEKGEGTLVETMISIK